MTIISIVPTTGVIIVQSHCADKFRTGEGSDKTQKYNGRTETIGSTGQNGGACSRRPAAYFDDCSIEFRRNREHLPTLERMKKGLI